MKVGDFPLMKLLRNFIRGKSPKNAMHPLDELLDIKAYTHLFTDAAFFTPYVRQACSASGLPCREIHSGAAGTFPTFIVDNKLVVKFFGPLFNGAHCVQAEQSAAQLLSAHPVLPAPALLAQGALRPSGAAWHWPYLIFAFVKGGSFGESFDRISPAQKLEIARRLGGWVRALHALPIPPEEPFDTGWDGFEGFLERQRAACRERLSAWGCLPPHLLAQVPGFLAQFSGLVDRTARPHLIHADLTGDHLLGTFQGEVWQTRGLIDFGDARTGDLYYELAALYLDMFRADRRLLAAFLEGFGCQLAPDFARRALAACLLHEFNLLPGLQRRFQSGGYPATLEELADQAWPL
jgi:hygromycin-B 7''-O-kinase